MAAIQLDLMVQPQEYFRDKLTEAAQNQKIELTNDVEFYLVNLLCDFIAPSKLETMEGELNVLATPLAMMLKQAVEAPPAQRLKIFRFLGDSSLYLAGFFQDYFNRKTYDIDYYITLGSAAYNNVSNIFHYQHGDEHFKELYENMAHRFSSLVELIAEVSDTGAGERPVNLLAIYDRWTKNQSDRLRRTLEKFGISPIPGLNGEKQ